MVGTSTKQPGIHKLAQSPLLALFVDCELLFLSGCWAALILSSLHPLSHVFPAHLFRVMLRALSPGVLCDPHRRERVPLQELCTAVCNHPEKMLSLEDICL